jgi:signal transduction histidine kinase
MGLQLALQDAEVPGDARTLVGDALKNAQSAVGELRELARGIHPAVLTHRGLAAAVRGLADRAPVPVVVDIADERYPNSVESAAYFVAAEALTNVAKYSGASTARVTTTRTAGHLAMTIDDDGVGGARPSADGGLAGLSDRLAAVDGTLTVSSEPGEGTRIRAEIPLPTGTLDDRGDGHPRAASGDRGSRGPRVVADGSIHDAADRPGDERPIRPAAGAHRRRRP